MTTSTIEDMVKIVTEAVEDDGRWSMEKERAGMTPEPTPEEIVDGLSDSELLREMTKQSVVSQRHLNSIRYNVKMGATVMVVILIVRFLIGFVVGFLYGWDAALS